MADDIAQNIKGSLQKGKGNLEMQSPHLDDKVKGAVDKVKGEWNKETSHDDTKHDKADY